MKRLFAAIALACVFSVSALAGEMPTMGSPAPSPSGVTQPTRGEIQSDPGDIPTDGIAEQISDVALSALLSVFELLG